MALKEGFYPSLDNQKECRIILQSSTECDKYDYLAAIGCGAIGGIIDVFLVGTPGDSILGKWSDQQVDHAVMSFAKKLGWSPKEKNMNNVRSAIGYLEHGRQTQNLDVFHGFKVNYDQRQTSDVGELFEITPSTHHMMSLGHSPDIIGLFFSVLNQFTNTSSFIANGKLVMIDTQTQLLYGGNFYMKLLCGIANWFGHLMSDVAGSSGSHTRGVGIVMPFYELFGFCKFGKFTEGETTMDFAKLAEKAYVNGYDFRHGITMAIPVVVTELSVRLIWSLRRRFQYKLPLKDSVPTLKYADLRLMLIIGNGTLMALDGIDAFVRSNGNQLAFFMRLNLVAWFRFGTLVLKEVCIRVGLSNGLDNTIEAFIQINEALNEYLTELEKIDIELFRKETEEYQKMISQLKEVNDKEQLNTLLLDMYHKCGYKKPWTGDFDDFMSDKNNVLTFE